jgi:hypothetical protein
MSDTSANYVSKPEFRLVSLGLGAVVVATLILSFPHGKTIVTANSPIVLTGGSMTAYTTSLANSSWSALGAGYCVNVNDTSEAKFTGEDGNSQDIALGTGPWTIDVFGHTNSGDNPSPKGFELSPQLTLCGSTTAGHSITIITIGSGGGFYASQIPTFTDRPSAVRFKDTNCGRDDADLCERLARVAVNGTPTYKCHTGDCSLAIGK